MNKYYDDYTITTLDTEIEEFKDGYYKFKETVFYGEKGGMPSDKGTINGLEVLDLKWIDDELWHKVDGELTNPIHMHVDEDNRLINTAVQTAFHALDGYHAKKGLYMPAVGCNPDNLWVEVNTKDVDDQYLQDLEDFENDLVKKDIPVTFTYVDGKDYPDEHYQKYDKVRIVTIGDVDTQPCGTLHLNSTKEIGGFVVLSKEKTSKGTRIYCALSKVVELRLKQYNKILHETALNLGVKLDECPSKSQELVSLLKETKKELNDVKKELNDLKAISIINNPEKIIKIETENANDIRLLAQSMMGKVSGNKIIYAIIDNEINFGIVSGTNEARNILELVKKDNKVIGGGSPKIVTAKVELSEEAFKELVK